MRSGALQNMLSNCRRCVNTIVNAIMYALHLIASNRAIYLLNDNCGPLRGMAR